MKKILYAWVGLLGIVSCSTQTGGTTIDERMQQKVDSLLTATLDTYRADWGVAMVMEVETGKVIAQVALERKDSVTFSARESLLTTPVEQGSLFIPVSMLVALNDGVVTPQDSVDTESGRWQVNGMTISDPNFARGGYGVISASQVVGLSSNIGIAKIISKGYSKTPDRFRDHICRLGWDSLPSVSENGVVLKFLSEGKTDLPANSYGYALQVSPVGMLMFYNGVANHGKMVLPQSKYCSTVVVKEAMASQGSINALQSMLSQVVESGTGVAMRSDRIAIAGKTGTTQLLGMKDENGKQTRMVASCGYFPAKNPKYSCIVTLYNPTEGYPSAGIMAGAVVKCIAEYIDHEQTK